MPLRPGKTPAVIGQNIREMREAGHPQSQSVAAAERMADKARGSTMESLASRAKAKLTARGRMESMKGKAKTSAELYGKGTTRRSR